MTLLVPEVRLLTDDARAALPASVPMTDAIFNVAHAGLLVEALTRDPALLRMALRDRLHQDVRLEAFDELQRRGVPVCVSGAGPTLLVFPGPSDEVEMPGARTLRAAVSLTGYEVIDG